MPPFPLLSGLAGSYNPGPNFPIIECAPNPASPNVSCATLMFGVGPGAPAPATLSGRFIQLLNVTFYATAARMQALMNATLVLSTDAVTVAVPLTPVARNFSDSFPLGATYTFTSGSLASLAAQPEFLSSGDVWLAGNGSIFLHREHTSDVVFPGTLRLLRSSARPATARPPV